MESTSKTKKTETTNKKHPYRGRFIHHGQNLHVFRERAGLSQNELAQKIGKSQQYISQLELSEMIEPDVIEKLAEALNIDPQYISDWTTDNSTNIFNIQKMGEGNGSTNMVGTNNFETNHEVHIYPIDKICELYERMLDEKNSKINNLEKSIEELKKELAKVKCD